MTEIAASARPDRQRLPLPRRGRSPQIACEFEKALGVGTDPQDGRFERMRTNHLNLHEILGGDARAGAPASWFVPSAAAGSPQIANRGPP
jgi:hypothetical protein